MTRTLEAVPILEDKAELGESPVWDEEEGVLWWIDWAQGLVYRTDVVAKESNTFHVGRSVAAVALSPTGRVALALGHGFAELDPVSGHVRELGRAEPDETETRMCDGKCDASGRFWAGTMALDERSPLGALFVMETDGRVRRVLDEVVVSNGLCWSLDNTKFYYIDTATRRIDVFDFDLARGTIANRAAVVEIPSGEGDPDGLTIDCEGYLWVSTLGRLAGAPLQPHGGARHHHQVARGPPDLLRARRHRPARPLHHDSHARQRGRTPGSAAGGHAVPCARGRSRPTRPPLQVRAGVTTARTH